MSVPSVTTWNGTRVIVTTERGEFFVVLDTIAEATRYAAELRGALADAFHAGRAEGFAEGQQLPNVAPHELDDVEEEWPTLGTQTSCEHCNLDVEWHEDRWLDRGGNWTCPNVAGEREHEHEGREQ